LAERVSVLSNESSSGLEGSMERGYIESHDNNDDDEDDDKKDKEEVEEVDSFVMDIQVSVQYIMDLIPPMEQALR
jgi:hypothetical protein